MHPFALATPKTIAEAATAASATVAHAMTTRRQSLTGQSDVSVIKAGGIDLLDLLKEDLLAPSKVINLREGPGASSTVVEEADGGLRIGPMVTLASTVSSSARETTALSRIR